MTSIKLEFKIEDFKEIGGSMFPSGGAICKTANRRLAEMLSSATAVYSNQNTDYHTWIAAPFQTDTHKALLINIEPIVKDRVEGEGMKHKDIITIEALKLLSEPVPFFYRGYVYARVEWAKLSLWERIRKKITFKKKEFLSQKDKEYWDLQPKKQIKISLPKPYRSKHKPDGHVHTMPNDKDHLESESCWCQPELINDFTSSGGCKHFLHKELQ